MLQKVRTPQKQIFQNLLEETMRDYASMPDKKKGVINMGANASGFSFRNDGKGIPADQLSWAVLSVPYDEVPDEPMSNEYDLNQYVGHEVLKIQSWQIGHCISVKYGRDDKTFKRKLMELNCFPAFDYTGFLVHIEYEPCLEKDEVLTVQDVIKAFRKIYSTPADGSHPAWKPELWFNGERVNY